MKNTFPGYYRPTEDEFSEIWENCLFVLDANVLLNLYRYSPETRKELLDILKEISDRLWVPHQAALEYHQNRLGVIKQQAAAYDSVQEKLRDSLRKLEDGLRLLIGKGRHPFLDADRLLERITIVFTEIEEEMKALSLEHPNLIDKDPLKETITALLEGKIGSSYPSERIGEIYKAGKTRYENKIPPGYQDAVKGNTRKYGDLILWFQIIDQAKAAKRPIILVTDDRKDDWWLRFNGQTIGPRPELVNEIVSKADTSFYMYSTDPFMEHARAHLERQISQQSIDEIREFRQRDEEYLRVAYLTRTVPLPYETLEAMSAATLFPPEALESMRAANQLPREMLESMRAANQLPREMLETMSAANQLPRETLEAMRAVTQLPRETLEAMRAATLFPPEALESMRAATLFSHETLKATRQVEKEAEDIDKEADERLSVGEN